jgi:hypothetical protein
VVDDLDASLRVCILGLWLDRWEMCTCMVYHTRSIALT